MRLDIEPESDSSDIVIRDKNGDFEIEDPPIQPFDEQEEGGNVDAQEDESRVFYVLAGCARLIWFCGRGEAEIS